jgi:Mn2+/Fe2+ NRAMP family transporter
VSGAGFVLIPHLPLIKVIFLSQVANGILLPFVLFYMLSLINNKNVMHEYKNNRFQNLIAGATSVTMILLTAKLLWSMFSPAAP